MKKYNVFIVIINLILVLFLFNYSACSKDKIIKNSDLFLLKLSPVDPRSLMQGDYMALNYEVLDSINHSTTLPNAYIVFNLLENRVAQFVRIQEEKLPLSENEYLLQYHKVANGFSINADAFYFQEGKAKQYEDAKYGAVKINKEGHAILLYLCDETFEKIE